MAEISAAMMRQKDSKQALRNRFQKTSTSAGIYKQSENKIAARFTTPLS
jgi:hypothetical protein